MNLEKSFRSLILLLTAGFFFFSCRPSYTLVSVEGGRIEIDSVLDALPHAEAAAIVSLYKARMDSIMLPVVGTSALNMTTGKPEGLLSNLISDVLLESAQLRTGRPADLAIMNMGGIRSDLPQGEITFGKIYEILPFENALCVVELSGDHLLSLFGEIAQSGGQGVAGVKLEISGDGKLLAARVAGAPVDPQKNYRIATIDYLAEGNDGFPSLAQHTRQECPENATLRELFLNYVQRQSAAGQVITATLDGRIMVKP
ncbi:MAG: 5'-nucleotidase C-terminal domain-containing protein [Bacteroides sp.]|nr:5'-nucleotidase C-terminal domain-containing protein [Bacteroides sp.]